MPRQALNINDNAAQKPAQGSGQKKEYKPSSWVSSRIDSIPEWIKKELKSIYNLDIDKLKQEENRYGVLEGFASNNFTLHPIQLEIDQAADIKKQLIDAASRIQGAPSKEDMLKSLSWLPSTKKEKGWFTVRLWFSPGYKSWGLERHEAKTNRFSKGEDGQYIKKEDGSDKMTWNRQPLDEGEAIRHDGRYFTKEQMDHFRLTFTLGEPVEERKGFNKDLYADSNAVIEEMKTKLDGNSAVTILGQTYKIDLEDNATKTRASKGDTFWVTNPAAPADSVCIWYDAASHSFRPAYVSYYLDDYNNHEVCKYYTKFVEMQLRSKLGDKKTFTMNGTQYSLNDGAIKAAANGSYVWASNVRDPSDKVNVWFDPRSRNFRPTIASNPKIGYEEAHRVEVEIAEKQRQKAAEQKANTQSQGLAR